MERIKKKEESSANQMKTFSLLPINAMKTVSIPFNDKTLEHLYEKEEYNNIHGQKKLVDLIDWKRLKTPKPGTNYQDGDEGWFLESIKTDGIAVQVILKEFVSVPASPKDIERDLFNASCGKKRRYGTIKGR